MSREKLENAEIIGVSERGREEGEREEGRREGGV